MKSGREDDGECRMLLRKREVCAPVARKSRMTDDEARLQSDRMSERRFLREKAAFMPAIAPDRGQTKPHVSGSCSLIRAVE